MCGKESSLFNAEIEGVVLQVCKDCAKYGKVLSRVRDPNFEQDSKREPSRTGRDGRFGSRFGYKNRLSAKEEPLEVISDNYSNLIRNTREKKGIKQEDFAKIINEKWSLVSGIESGKIKPSIELAKKIEKNLGIKIVEEIENSGVLSGSSDLDLDPEESTSSSKYENSKENNENNTGVFTIGDMIKKRGTNK